MAAIIEAALAKHRAKPASRPNRLGFKPDQPPLAERLADEDVIADMPFLPFCRRLDERAPFLPQLRRTSRNVTKHYTVNVLAMLPNGNAGFCNGENLTQS